MRCWALAGAIGFAVWVLCGVASPAPCAARARGVAAQGCQGCHFGGDAPQTRLTAMGEAMPGQPLRLLLEIEAINGPIAGFYLTADGGGTLSTVMGQGTQALAGGIAHATPKTGTGFVRFELDWMAPDEPTAVLLRVWSVSANDNNNSGGDGASVATLSLVSGCEGELYFVDADRDGYGSSSSGMRLDCEQREGFALVGGDCNDNDAAIHPGADEYCNERDDDCDGLVDEGSVPQAHYPDPDGDGYGERGSQAVLECPPPRGYAPNDDDCLEGDATVHPAAIEVCDGIDNDCDNRIDELVKPSCGLGWCRRGSWSCREDDCEPGEPRAEQCNAFDDDCDGTLDEGADCGAGLMCEQGSCVPAGATAGQSATAGQGSMPSEGASSAPIPPQDDPGSAAPASKAGGCSALRMQPSRWTELLAVSAVALRLLSKRRRKGARSSATSRHATREEVIDRA